LVGVGKVNRLWKAWITVSLHEDATNFIAFDVLGEFTIYFIHNQH
jgi:hypothetical protein